MEGGASELRRQRLARLGELREQGVEPFALNYRRTHSINDALAAFDAAETTGGEGTRTDPVSIAGRVMRHRSQGKVGFADLVDATGKLQLYARADALGDEGIRLFNDLDLGDIVGATGPLFRTRRGEVSLDLDQLTMLTKALRPLPDKWHGLRDPELRFRQRHVDFIANPDAARVLRLRSALIAHIRQFLDARGFLEVETPVLSKVAGGAAARPFVTHHNTLDRDLYLRIALELHLKRMLIGGFERVYEIGRVFRNEGISPKYNPEFTILELYEAYTDYKGMMELMQGLLQSAAQSLLGGTTLTYQEEAIELGGDWPRRELSDLVREARPDLELADETGLRDEAARLGAQKPEALTWGGALYEVFERLVVPNLRQPTFITGHPIDVSPLARRRADDPRLVERFELYVAGREIADAFSELTDPIDQRERFEQQAAAHAAGVEETHPMDEDFIAALEQGMPPAGGLGAGIDRLAALFADVPNIRETIAFPLLRDEPGSADAAD